jgi:uroporphyrinogen decarboxylase
MNSFERYHAAMQFKKPDRVPLDVWVRDELWEELKKYVGIQDDEEMRQYLGLDIYSAGCHVDFPPDFKERLKKQGKKGARVIFHPDGGQESIWGYIERPGADGMYMEWVSGPFKDDPDLSRFNFPDFSILEKSETIKPKVDRLHKLGFPVHGGVSLPFKMCWHQRGLENFMMDMYINQEFAEKLLDWWYAFETEKGCRIAKAGADTITITGDIGMQDRLMLNPEKWRELEKPRMKKMIQAFKKANPKKPPYAFFHSDGDVSEVIPDLIEIGLDILNPIQPECMDVAEIGRLYRGKLRFHGAISIQETLPKGTEADVRKEVRHRIDHLGPNGGYILCPANATQLDTPVTNLLAMYDEAKKYSAEVYARK